MAVIVGAGPSGLLLAHLILCNASKSELAAGLLPIKIYEARDDPRLPLPLYKSRQYVVGLSARGRDAVSKVDGLWDAVSEEGIPSSQFVLHIGSRVIPLKRNPEKPSLLINQRSLAAVLLQELQKRYSSDQVEVHFGCRCTEADFETHEVRFKTKEKDEVIQYDLLVGADGSRSVVRQALIRERNFDYQQINEPYTFKVLHVPRPAQLSDDAVHSFRLTKNRDTNQAVTISFGCFPTPKNGMSVLLSWSPQSKPNELLQIQSATELKSYIEMYMPPLKVPLEAAEAFIQQRPSTSMQVQCSRFHDMKGKAVLLGDAAHAMSNALGQGCNSSLKDAEAFGTLLLQKENMNLAMEKYSEMQVKEDHAAAYLSKHAFPQANWLRSIYLLGNIVSSSLSNTPLSPLVPPPIQSLCSETLVPYSEIKERNKFWLKLAEVTNILASAETSSS